MRDIRTLNMSEGQKIESDLVTKRIGDLSYRNLGTFMKSSLFDSGKALIVGNGLRVEPSSGMTINVPSGSVFQRFNDVIPCIQIEDQTVTLEAATGVARTDIIEAQVQKIADKNDYSQVATIASGSAISITNELIKRDIKYYLSVRRQTDTTDSTVAIAGVLTGTIAIPGTIDLSTEYLLNISDGEDGSFQEIDCRGATPIATTPTEIINAINAAVGRTMASIGAGDVIVLTGNGEGESSYFEIKPPATDTDKDCLQIVFGVSIGGAYRYVYEGTNEWFKLAEFDVGTTTTVITTGLIRNIDQKNTWASESSDIVVQSHLYDHVTITNDGNMGLGLIDSGLVSNSLVSGPFFALGDTDTGIGQDGTDILDIWTGGVRRVTVDNAGNIGIGINSPSFNFQLNSDTVVSYFHITNDDSGTTTSDGLVLGLLNEVAILNVRSDWPLTILTNDSERIRISNDGMISTGGETEPDILAHGICTKTDGNGNTFTHKRSSITHGFSSIAEVDTFLEIEDIANGRTIISTYSTNSSTNSLVLNCYADVGSSADGACTISGFKRSGTNISSLGAGEGIFQVANAGTTKLRVYGNGDTKSSTGSFTIFDDEEDLQLVRTLNAMFYDGPNKRELYPKIIKKYGKKLENLGIIENGFRSHDNSWALNLGAIGQLFNIVKNIGKKLNLSEEQLLEFSKDY